MVIKSRVSRGEDVLILSVLEEVPRDRFYRVAFVRPTGSVGSGIVVPYEDAVAMSFLYDVVLCQVPNP